MDEYLSKKEVINVLNELKKEYMYTSYEYQGINKALERIRELNSIGQIADSDRLEDDMR